MHLSAYSTVILELHLIDTRTLPLQVFISTHLPVLPPFLVCSIVVLVVDDANQAGLLPVLDKLRRPSRSLYERP